MDGIMFIEEYEHGDSSMRATVVEPPRHSHMLAVLAEQYGWGSMTGP